MQTHIEKNFCLIFHIIERLNKKLHWLCTVGRTVASDASGQSYKRSTTVIYNSRVVIWKTPSVNFWNIKMFIVYRRK